MHTPQVMRMTGQREAIIDELRLNGGHSTADEIHERVRRRLPRMSLGTVYRNPAILSRAGLIRQLQLGGAPAGFDGDPRPHYHIRRSRCGRMDDAPIEPLWALDQEVSRASGREITGHRIEFVGICAGCGDEHGPVVGPGSEGTSSADSAR